MARTYLIHRLEGGAEDESSALAMLNAPLDEIQTALNELSSGLEAVGSKCSVVYEHAPVSAACVPGTLVYYNEASGHARFEPARAELSGEPGSQGESVESPRSRVVGLVVRVDSGSPLHATLLCGGFYEDAAVVRECLGQDATAGTYYLSPFVDGRAVRADQLNGRLQQGVLTYLGDGKLVFGLHYLAHDNHWHGSLTINGGWTSVSTPPAGVTPPSGYYWWYAPPASSGIGALSSRTTAVFHNGLLQDHGTGALFKVDAAGYLWYAGADVPVSGSVVLFNSYPFSYNHAIVRSIESNDNDALQVTSNNGSYLLTQNAFVSESPSRSALAVSAITGRRLGFTPVVTGIMAGPGLVASVASNGVATLSLSSLVGALHDAYVLDHNSTNAASDGIYPYIMFPAGRTSSLTITMPLCGIPADTVLDAKVWIMGLSGGAYSVETRWVPDPVAGTATSLNTVQPVTGTVSVQGVANGMAYGETYDTCRINGSGTLVSSLSVTSAPSSDQKLFRLGYRFSLVSTQEAVQEQTVTRLLVKEAYTAQAITAHSAVMLVAGGKLAPCGSGNSATAGKCVGVALSGATAANQLVQYISSGVLESTSFNYTANASLYVGTDGALTTSDTTNVSGAAYVQRIGTALSAKVVLVDIGDAVLKG